MTEQLTLNEYLVVIEGLLKPLVDLLNEISKIIWTYLESNKDWISEAIRNKSSFRLTDSIACRVLSR